MYERGDDKPPAPWNPDKGKIDRVIDALKSVVFQGDYVTAPSWLNERSDRVIACENGLLRVSDRRILPHTPEYFNTFALPFGHDPNADEPGRWLQFLDEILPGDRVAQETLQEWFGYVLSGRTDLQKMLMLIGPTRSGKGTIDKLLAALVGVDNHIGLAASDMRNDFGLQPLLGKTLAVFSDERVSIDGKRFVETLLRITGEDKVTVNRKNRDSWIGQLGTRLMFMSNEPPMLPDASGAIVGRMIALHLPNSFLNKEDHGLIGKLYAELPGILNWSLDGLDRLTERERFRQPRSGEQVIGLLQESASSVEQFVTDRCVLGPEHHVRTAGLYAHWKSWCSENGYDPGSSATFGRKLFALGRGIENRKHGPKGQQKRHYFGIGFQWNTKAGPRLIAVQGRKEEEA
ncbi:hypothetical protein A5633_23000 [Mycolicibacterium elephantis]|nr:hypothetical protein A5633_23000 [Mycolicibacterium elephantis]